MAANSSTTDAIRAALSRPETYPHRPSNVEVHETHISIVFIADELVYKLKKPLVLDFLDYGSPARRHEMCREEVRLNRRLAPHIYRGVRGVAGSDGGFELTDEHDERASDFVVEMTRYDEAETVATRLARGALQADHMSAVGARLAQFHARARVISVAAPAPATVKRFVQNGHELLATLGELDEIARVIVLERFAHTFVARHEDVLRDRASRGLIREGHGDLRAEHVLVRDTALAVDCVEFDPALRELDVADDLAFLVFDLVAYGGEDFVSPLLAAYRNAGGDPGPDWLVAFYSAYRALVRAKVRLVRAGQLRDDAAEEAAADGIRLIGLAERLAWRARLPVVLVTCGVPASGKSTVARALAKAARLPYLNSDLVRKRLAGIQDSERGPAAIYTPEWNRRTYGELGRQAAAAARDGGGAVIDATFRHRSDRDTLRAAFAGEAPLVFIECTAPGPVLAERARHRETDPAEVSDADVRVVEHERTRWEPLDEVAAAAHVLVRTDRGMDDVEPEVIEALDRRLGELDRPT